MGARTSSWSSASQSSSTTDLTDSTYISTSSHPPSQPHPTSTTASPPTPPPSLTSGPITLPPTNPLPTPTTSDDANVGGGKTIDYVGSLALLLNNVTGGGMVLFAQMYQEAGWLLPTLALVLLMVVCGVGGVMLVECMSMMPGNGRFQRRVEYTSVMKHYCTRRWYVLISLFYQLSLTITNLSLIIQSIQVMDFAIVAIADRTCAVPELYPTPSFHCPPPSHDLITPFEADVWVIPLGLFFTALIVIPLGLVNLDDNVKVQKGAFIALLLIVLTWVGIMASEAPHASYVRTVGDNLSTVLGVSLFNFAFVSSIPSWVCEKREDVSITRTLGTVLPLAVGIFILMGWLGGTAFAPWDGSDTLLDQLRDTNAVGKLTFFAFPIIVNLTSIPVLSIFQRYNLLSEKVCGKAMANFLAVVLPWLIAIPLYNGAGYQNLANWGGVLITSVVNFLVPIVVYIVAVRRAEAEKKAQQAASSTPGAVVALSQQQQSRTQGGDETNCTTDAITAAPLHPPPALATQLKREGESVEQATGKAEKPRRTLSISGAVEWLKKAGSGKRPADQDDGLGAAQQPSPLHHFSFSTASTSLESELAHPSHSPATPGQSSSSASSSTAEAEEEKLSHSPVLKSQALRWANEEDSRQRAAIAASFPFPRDSIQPASGSLRLARPPSSSTSTPPSSLSTSSSRQNLLASLSSSFTSRSPLPDPDREVEMTPTNSAERPRERKEAGDAPVAAAADDTFDVDEIQVEEVGVAEEEEDEEEEKKQGRLSGGAGGSQRSAAGSRAGSTRSLPVIDEGRRENSQSMGDAMRREVGMEEQAEEEERGAAVTMPAVEVEDGARWSVVKEEWLPYRVHVAVVTLAIMSVLCVLALEEQIRQQISNQGWS